MEIKQEQNGQIIIVTLLQDEAQDLWQDLTDLDPARINEDTKLLMETLQKLIFKNGQS